MVDSVVTKQELIDAQKDAQSLEDVINGPADTRVKPRIGPEMWTLATINSLVQQGQIKISDLSEAIQIALAAGAGSAGWTANLVADGNQTQKEINLFGGKKYDMPVGGYPLGAVVRLDNGDIVKSTVANNIVNPNVDMEGWVEIGSLIIVNTVIDLLAIKNPSDNMIVYANSLHAGFNVGSGEFVYNNNNPEIYDGGVCFGKWRRKFDTLTPQMFGVISAFSTKTLADSFSSLAAAQVIYSNATSLTELQDRVAFDRYLMYLIKNNVRTDWSCQILLDKPLISYTVAKTLQVDGYLELKSHQTNIPYMLHIATNQLVLSGMISCIGTQTDWRDMRTRYTTHGVVMGAITELGLTGNAQNISISSVIGRDLKGYALYLGFNCHFSRSDHVRGVNCGSANNHPTPYLQGVVDSFSLVSSVGGDVNQSSTLAVTNIDFIASISDNIGLLISGLPYSIKSIDAINKTVTIYPALPENEASASLLYVFGGALKVSSNNSACTQFDVVQAIVCGYGYNSPALYGSQISSFISEACGFAIQTGGRNQANLGCVIDLAYFEGNKIDIAYGWTSASSNGLKLLQTIALNFNKVFNMSAYTFGSIRRTDWNVLDHGSMLDGYTVNRDIFDITKSSHSSVTKVGSGTYTLKYSPKIAELTIRYSKSVDFIYSGSGTGIVTINPPTGYTINNSNSATFNLADYDGVVKVTFSVPTSATAYFTNIELIVTGVRKVSKGTTAQRPSSPTLGQSYYDTTLLAAGKPINWNGSAWVDSTGAPV